MSETAPTVRAAEAYIRYPSAELQTLQGAQEGALLTEAEIARFAAAGTLAATLDEVVRVGGIQAQRLIVERLIAGVWITTFGQYEAKRATVDVARTWTMRRLPREFQSH